MDQSIKCVIKTDKKDKLVSKTILKTLINCHCITHNNLCKLIWLKYSHLFEGFPIVIKKHKKTNANWILAVRLER